MSFSWRTNSWGGEVGATNNLSRANVVSDFPDPPLLSKNVSQAEAHSLYYRIPDYMILKDMATDKNPLIIQRGGYSGENPYKQPSKLNCYKEQQSSNYYCSGNSLQY